MNLRAPRWHERCRDAPWNTSLFENNKRRKEEEERRKEEKREEAAVGLSYNSAL